MQTQNYVYVVGSRICQRTGCLRCFSLPKTMAVKDLSARLVAHLLGRLFVGLLPSPPEPSCEDTITGGA
ncbi:hypothetical protein KCV07_g451, partial [Aureobasidium melanogenum]